MRGPTGVKFYTIVSSRSSFIMPVQNFGGPFPKKFRGQKHAKFGPISDDFEVRQRISSKKMKIFKIEQSFVYGDSSCVRRNKYNEVWSSDLGDLDVKSYPPKAHFSEDRRPISAPRGCCPPKFLHALENDQLLLAHPHWGRRLPLQLFSKGGVKNWLKMQSIRRRIFGAKRSSFMRLCHVTCCQMGVITQIQLLGGTAPLKFGSAKNAQNLVRLTTTFEFERKYL